MLAALACGVAAGCSQDAWENPLAGAQIERLTDFEGVEADAAISPDGKFVAFLSDRNGKVDAWVTRVGGGEFVNRDSGPLSRFAPAGNPECRILPGRRAGLASSRAGCVWAHHSSGHLAYVRNGWPTSPFAGDGI